MRLMREVGDWLAAAHDLPDWWRQKEEKITDHWRTDGRTWATSIISQLQRLPPASTPSSARYYYGRSAQLSSLMPFIHLTHKHRLYACILQLIVV